MGRRFLTAGREAWPVVEVDDANVAFGAYYAVAAVNLHIKNLARVLADGTQLLLVKFKSLRLAVDGFVAVFGVAEVEGVEPEEERSALNAVELYEVAHEVTVDDGALDAAQEVLL